MVVWEFGVWGRVVVRGNRSSRNELIIMVGVAIGRLLIGVMAGPCRSPWCLWSQMCVIMRDNEVWDGDVVKGNRSSRNELIIMLLVGVGIGGLLIGVMAGPCRSPWKLL